MGIAMRLSRTRPSLGGNASRRDVRGMDSRKLTTREITRTGAEITTDVQ